MKFPAYVPAAVREYVKNILKGETGKRRGIESWRENVKARLAELESIIKECERRLSRTSCADMSNAYREKIVELLKEKDQGNELLTYLNDEIDCLHRLVAHDKPDDQMRNAYEQLAGEFTDDEQWKSFISAACEARKNFKSFRKALQEARQLSGKIAGAAEKLAELLREFEGLRVYGPSEFFSIPALLEKTENHEFQGHNLHRWRSVRHCILGDPSIGRIFIDDGKQMGVEDEVFICPEKLERDFLTSIWGVAPGLPSLLDTLANAARNSMPSSSDINSSMIDAAIQSRKRNPKTEYLRAFGSLLADSHGLTLTTPIMQAMAMVANVVLNSPDVDVSYDDVRKALARLGGECLEDSGEK